MISLRLAKALKEAGYPQEASLFYWYTYTNGRNYLRYYSEMPKSIIDAWAVQDTLEILDWLEKEKGYTYIEFWRQPIEPKEVQVMMQNDNTEDEGTIIAFGKTRQEAFENCVLKALKEAGAV